MSKKKVAAALLSTVLALSLLQGCAAKRAIGNVGLKDSKDRVEMDKQSHDATTAHSNSTSEAGADKSSKVSANATSGSTAQNSNSTSAAAKSSSKTAAKQPAPKSAPVVQSSSTPAVKPIEAGEGYYNKGF